MNIKIRSFLISSFGLIVSLFLIYFVTDNDYIKLDSFFGFIRLGTCIFLTLPVIAFLGLCIKNLLEYLHNFTWFKDMVD